MTAKITRRTNATTIVREDALGWVVKCEHADCPNTIRVPRTVRSPGRLAVTVASPKARGCVSHPLV